MQRDGSRQLIETMEHFSEGGPADDEEQDHVDLDLSETNQMAQSHRARL